MPITHAWQSPHQQGPNADQLGPNQWNAGHKFDLPVSLGGFATLTNVGAAYDTTAAARGLGCVLVDMTGVDTVEFRVMVNKVGSGTQSWQLWNETDGSEVGAIDDAGGAGNKTLSATLTGLALTGLKLLRVRVKSTTAADDPVYQGSSLLLRKTT